MCMANIRQKEFERSCIELLYQMLTCARVEADKLGKTVYEIEFSKDSFERHFTTYFSCSSACFERYFENLKYRRLIVEKTKDDFILNPKRAKSEEVFRLTNARVLFPSS